MELNIPILGATPNFVRATEATIKNSAISHSKFLSSRLGADCVELTFSMIKLQLYDSNRSVLSLYNDT